MAIGIFFEGEIYNGSFGEAGSDLRRVHSK
jgi:hypothetical protein